MKNWKRRMGILAAGILAVVGTTQVFAVGFTAEQAKQIAMGYVPTDSIHIATEEEYDKYEVKLFSERDKTFYEIDVAKNTQKATSFESKLSTGIGSTQAVLSQEQVKKIVQTEIPEAQFLSVQLDWDDGLQEYEVKFYHGNNVGEYKINPQNGVINERYVAFGVGTTWQGQKVTTPQVATPQATITMEQAKEIALAQAPGAVVWKLETDREHGRIIYEGELRKGNIEYEFEIDGTTGAILDWDVDIDD